MFLGTNNTPKQISTFKDKLLARNQSEKKSSHAQHFHITFVNHLMYDTQWYHQQTVCSLNTVMHSVNR